MNSVIILHGWNLEGSRYFRLARYFTNRKITVFCPDLPGFGNNSKLEKVYSMQDYLSFLEDFIDKKKMKKMILIGHSFGGRIALLFTSRYPAKVSKLVLTGVPGISPVSGLKVLIFLFLSKVGKKVFGLPFLIFLEKPARRILYRISGSTDYNKTSGFLRESFKNVIKFDLLSCMKKIRRPTYLIWGEKDGIVPLSIAHKMKNLIYNSKLEIISGATHKAPYENSSEFIKILEKYSI